MAAHSGKLVFDSASSVTELDIYGAPSESAVQKEAAAAQKYSGEYGSDKYDKLDRTQFFADNEALLLYAKHDESGIIQGKQVQGKSPPHEYEFSANSKEELLDDDEKESLRKRLSTVTSVRALFAIDQTVDLLLLIQALECCYNRKGSLPVVAELMDEIDELENQANEDNVEEDEEENIYHDNPKASKITDPPKKKFIFQKQDIEDALGRIGLGEKVTFASKVPTSSSSNSNKYTPCNKSAEKLPDVSERESELLKETERLRMDVTCKVCWDAEATMLYLPCSHIASCVDCTEKLELCPICRTQIKAVVRAFRC